MRHLFFSTITNGKLQPSVSKLITAHLKNLEGKRVEISIRLSKSTRTSKQNALWWVYLTIISDYTGIPKDEIHDLLKSKFLTKPIELINKATGEITTDHTFLTTTSLSKEQFSELIESIQQWASEFLGLYLPSPNEQTSLEVQ